MAGYGTFQDYLSQSQKNTLPAKPTSYMPPSLGNINPATDNMLSLPEFYQVKPEDTDLASVASNLGAPLQQLVDNNDGAKTLPPIGSYIQTGANSFTSAAGGVNLQNNPRIQQLINQGVPPSVAAQMATGTGGITNNAVRPGMAGNRPDLSWINERQTVMQSLSMGQLPQTISSTAAGTLTNPATGRPFTSQELIASGYSFNTAMGSWVLAPGGAGAPGGPGGGGEYITDPSKIMVNFGGGGRNVGKGGGRGRRAAGFQTTLKWARNAWRRKRRGGTGQPVVAAGEPVSGGGTASTVLELHLGSG